MSSPLSMALSKYFKKVTLAFTLILGKRVQPKVLTGSTAVTLPYRRERERENLAQWSPALQGLSRGHPGHRPVDRKDFLTNKALVQTVFWR